MSCGRGTEKQFQIFGSPYLPSELYTYTFTPQPNFGSSDPKYKNQECHGLDLSTTDNLKSINLSWLINAYEATPVKKEFFRIDAFDKLAGTTKLRAQIEQGLSVNEIRKSWERDLTAFKKIREKYLIYSSL